MSATFPLRDPVGPHRMPLTRSVIDLIADVVAEPAERADREGVPRSTIDALAAAGLVGDALQPASAMRELAEVLAGADASTWFCWVQHQTPLRTLSGDAPGIREGAHPALAHELLPRLRSGDALAAVAFAHVRRPGPPNPVARRVAGGWHFDGRLDWVTSWDIADVVMVMAQGAPPDDDALICGYLPAGAGGVTTPGLTPGPPLDLLAMAGTHTRPIELADVFVPDDRVGAVLDRAGWLAHDAQRTLDANPSAFGVARGAIAQLDEVAQGRSDDRLANLVDELSEAVRVTRAAAYAASDEGADPATRVALRARSLDLATTAAEAVVATLAGAAMLRGRPAERRLREAMFLLVQAQTAATRQASLDRLVERLGD